MAEAGVIDKDKRVAYIVFSHGMFILQMGNMMKALEENPDKYAMPDTDNYKELKQQLLEPDV